MIKANSSTRSLLQTDDNVVGLANCIGRAILDRDLTRDELEAVLRRMNGRSVAATRTAKPTDARLTPPQVARMLGVNAGKVLGWIRSGELRAVNIAAKTTGRPRYRISAEDLRAFEDRRSCRPESPPPRRPRRKNEGVIEFF